MILLISPRETVKYMFNKGMKRKVITQIPQKTIQNEKQDIVISEEVYNLKRDYCP